MVMSSFQREGEAHPFSIEGLDIQGHVLIRGPVDERGKMVHFAEESELWKAGRPVRGLGVWQWRVQW